MDTLKTHKSQNACGAMRKRQAEASFFLPIAQSSIQLKKVTQIQTKAVQNKAKIEKELFTVTAPGLNSVTTDDAQAWFGSCLREYFKGKMLSFFQK